MPRRFIQTSILDKEWFLDLSFDQKAVFMYIYHRCDNGGFMDISPRVNAFLLGITKERYNSIIESLKHLYEFSNDGKRLWLTGFIRLQANYPLKESNNAHKQIIEIYRTNIQFFDIDLLLNASGVSPNDLGAKLGANKGLNKGLCNSNSNSSGNSNGNTQGDIGGSNGVADKLRQLGEQLNGDDPDE